MFCWLHTHQVQNMFVACLPETSSLNHSRGKEFIKNISEPPCSLWLWCSAKHPLTPRRTTRCHSEFFPEWWTLRAPKVGFWFRRDVKFWETDAGWVSQAQKVHTLFDPEVLRLRVHHKEYVYKAYSCENLGILYQMNYGSFLWKNTLKPSKSCRRGLPWLSSG